MNLKIATRDSIVTLDYRNQRLLTSFQSINGTNRVAKFVRNLPIQHTTVKQRLSQSDSAEAGAQPEIFKGGHGLLKMQPDL